MNADIQKSIQVIENKGVILYPTDTIWGLGCDATDTMAVQKIFDIKQRNENKSLIILVHSIEMLKRYTQVEDFMIDFLISVTGPTTVIYPNAKNLAKNVIAKDNSVAIRLVQDAFCQELIEKLDKPIVSTSANISGNPTPFIFSEIENQIIQKCDYVVKYRQMDFQKKSPSRLVRFTSDQNIIFLR